jgi:hypothetical protein
MRLVRSFSALAALSLLSGLLGCDDPPNHLEGSISSNVSLEFDDTRLIRFPSLALRLEYLKTLESGAEDIVARLVFDTPEGGIQAGERIDIAEHNGVVERVVAAGDGFPAFDTAHIIFDEGGNDPGPARGSFAVTFENGRTLNGKFDVELEDVDF